MPRRSTAPPAFEPGTLDDNQFVEALRDMTVLSEASRSAVQNRINRMSGNLYTEACRILMRLTATREQRGTGVSF